MWILQVFYICQCKVVCVCVCVCVLFPPQLRGSDLNLLSCITHHVLKIEYMKSSVESQKGAINIQRCSIENRKGCHSTMSVAIAPFWFSREYLWILIPPPSGSLRTILYDVKALGQISPDPNPSRTLNPTLNLTLTLPSILL